MKSKEGDRELNKKTVETTDDELEQVTGGFKNSPNVESIQTGLSNCAPMPETKEEALNRIDRVKNLPKTSGQSGDLLLYPTSVALEMPGVPFANESQEMMRNQRFK